MKLLLAVLVPMMVLGAVFGAERIGEFRRPPQPDGLSAITHVDGNRYLMLDDTGGMMYEATVEMDGTGEIKAFHTNSVVRLEGVRDGEGLAYDPLCGTVWAADEIGPRISEHDARTGRRLREVKLPACFSRYRRDVSVESLAISRDGFKMWTANEETLKGDGEKATRTAGGVVRLQRFARRSGKDEWKRSGQFAYVVDPMGGGKFRNASRSGLSDLCLTSDGRLFAIEREFSIKDFLPSFRLRIYRVDTSGATDVSGFEKLEGCAYVPVKKTLELDADTGFAMYEGATMAARLDDGSSVMVLVSDGDAEAIENLMTVKFKSESGAIQGKRRGE